MTRQRVMAGLVIVATAGCGGSGERRAEQAAEQVQQGAEQIQRAAEQAAEGGAQQLAEGLQQMTQGLQQMQDRVAVVDFEVLKGLLPTVPGWTQSSARGEQVSMPIRVSRAEARYNRGDSNIELEITDSAMSQILLAPMSMFMASGYSERADDGFRRAARIGGHPGSENWNSQSRRAEVTTIVSNRFIVRAAGREVDDLAPVRQIVEAVNLSTLESLK